MFRLPDGYVENPGPVYFPDDHTRDIVFQPDVIPYAEGLTAELGLSLVVDVGCGTASKLAELHERRPEWDLRGVDYGANLAVCRARHAWGTWIGADLDDLDDQRFDWSGGVVVAADVIEHLVDPRPMLGLLRLSGAARFVFSTPERARQYPPDHNGPPLNLCHVREWDRFELADFLVEEGFSPLVVTVTRSNDRGCALNTTLIEATA
jgi:SAM-dependent methyltransferase